MHRPQLTDEFSPSKRKNWINRLQDSVFAKDQDDEYEEEYEEIPVRSTRPNRAVVLQAATRYNVTIRRQVISTDDAEAVIQGIRDGQQQILNMTSTEASVRFRVFYMIEGARMALDAHVEEIGEHIYLVAPANINIAVEPLANGQSNPAYN